jgi:hypothetical protein
MRRLIGYLLVLAVALAGYVGHVYGQAETLVTAEQLSAAMTRWQPIRRDHENIARLARAYVHACARMTNPIPDRPRCPALLAALTFREASWLPGAVGARGEIGLFQLMRGPPRNGQSARALLNVDVNTATGARWLDRSAVMCGTKRHLANYPERVLTAYGGGGCVPSRAARMVLRWTERIHALTGR